MSHNKVCRHDPLASLPEPCSVCFRVTEAVDHPAHYGGGDNPYEAIKVIDAWSLGFALGNTVKYVSRAGKKDRTKEIEDLKKAAWYLNHRISQLEGSSLAAERLREAQKLELRRLESDQS